MFVLVFGLLSPLAIYRGPLNVWGLGSGIVALLASCGMNPVSYTHLDVYKRQE